ncbi:MAG: ATP-binding domain-containing protein, partial [Alloprevotella tannerae]|nr:ATP-binding domain-containing protein [Alloprevotella tannerae]
SLDQVAILYRTNAQSGAFEGELRNAALPYRVYGGLSFYQRKEIKDIIAYCRVVCNPQDEEALLRIVNYPTRGIGQTTMSKLIAAARGNGEPLWSVLLAPDKFGVALNRRTLEKLYAFAELIRSFQARADVMGVYDLVSELLEASGITQELQGDRTPEGLSKWENILELLNLIKGFESEQETGVVLLADYLPQAVLLTDQDQQDDDEPKVTLMTVHAAKGLEFEAVFVTGLEDGLFPGTAAKYSARELEEERRLFYVAVTRAKAHCFITYVKNRFIYGRSELREPSIFLQEIDPKYVKTVNSSARDFSSFGHLNSGRMAGLFDAAKVDRKPAPSDFNSPTSSSFVADKAFSRRSSAFEVDSSRTTVQQGRLRRLSQAATTTENTDAGSASYGLQVGATILHERFGRGVVRSIEGRGINMKAVVDFEQNGTKNLLLKYAKFKLLTDE